MIYLSLGTVFVIYTILITTRGLHCVFIVAWLVLELYELVTCDLRLASSVVR